MVVIISFCSFHVDIAVAGTAISRHGVIIFAIDHCTSLGGPAATSAVFLAASFLVASLRWRRLVHRLLARHVRVPGAILHQVLRLGVSVPYCASVILLLATARRTARPRLVVTGLVMTIPPARCRALEVLIVCCISVSVFALHIHIAICLSPEISTRPVP